LITVYFGSSDFCLSREGKVFIEYRTGGIGIWAKVFTAKIDLGVVGVRPIFSCVFNDDEKSPQVRG